MPPDIAKFHEPINRTQQVARRNMPFKREFVEQRLLCNSPFAHHRWHSRIDDGSESTHPHRGNQIVFQHWVMGRLLFIETDNIGSLK